MLLVARSPVVVPVWKVLALESVPEGNVSILELVPEGSVINLGSVPEVSVPKFKSESEENVRRFELDPEGKKVQTVLPNGLGQVEALAVANWRILSGKVETLEARKAHIKMKAYMWSKPQPSMTDGSKCCKP